MKGSGNSGSTPLSDTPLLDLLDALVNDQGRLVAAEAGIDYPKMAACYESLCLSRRMRRALEEYRDTDVDGNEQGNDAGHMAEWWRRWRKRIGI